MSFYPAGTTHIELPGAGVLGSLDRGIKPPLAAPSIDLTIKGAALAPETVTFNDPVDLTNSATWIHVGVTANEDLTGLDFVGTNGTTYAYPAAGSSSSLDAGASISSGASSYFAVNVTNAVTNGLAFTARSDQGDLDFEIAVV